MNAKQMIELLLSGAKPVIEFVSGIEDMEGADPGMRGQITAVVDEDVDLLKIEVNLKPYEDHNKAIAIKDWGGDDNLTWMETRHYPKDGVWSFFIDASSNYPIPFRLVSEKSRLLMSQFLAEKPGTTYIEWLESKIL